MPDNNIIEQTAQHTTKRTNCDASPPTLLLPPAGIEPDFAIFKDGAWDPASLVQLLAGNVVAVIIPIAGGTHERVRYVPDTLVWDNDEGGFLEGFDLPVPFP